MLSTNDCYPGCACEDDRFQITEQRLGKWISKEHPGDVSEALDNLDRIICSDQAVRAAAAEQLDLSFDSDHELSDWLSEWRRCIAAVTSRIKHGEQDPAMKGQPPTAPQPAIPLT